MASSLRTASSSSLVAGSFFEGVSHRRPGWIAPPHKLDRSQGKADIAGAALNMWLMSTGEALAFLAVVAALTALALAA